MQGLSTDTGRLNPKINIWDVDINYKGLVSCRNNEQIMEIMGKGLTVPKWVLIIYLPNLSA